MFFLSFRDYDEKTNQDLDICGEDYEELISFCCCHSDYCSLFLDKSLLSYPPVTMNLSQDEKQLLQGVKKKKAENMNGEVWYLSCEKDTKTFLLSHCYSVFDWNVSLKNPANLSFYRDDQSFLFVSNSHIGVCYLRISERNAGIFLHKQGWKKENLVEDDLLEALSKRIG